MVVKELKEMGVGGGVGCYGGGVGVEKMVVVVFNLKKMVKKKKVDLMVVLRRKEMKIEVLMEMEWRPELDGALAGGGGRRLGAAWL